MTTDSQRIAQLEQKVESLEQSVDDLRRCVAVLNSLIDEIRLERLATVARSHGLAFADPGEERTAEGVAARFGPS
jgi:cell division protein FtsB